MKEKSKSLSILLNGIIVENPILVMLLGMCPTLAITNKFSNALGMGLAFLFVLFFSNLIISLIRKLVPNEIRIPVYIVIIATLVTIVQLLLKAYLNSLYESLGAFVALIVVNCIILGRAEAFASQNKPGHAVLDAIGMAFGFTLSLMLIAFVREFLGAGTITIWGDLVIDCTAVFDFLHIEPIAPLASSSNAVGSFLILGLIIGIVNAIRINTKNKKEENKTVVAKKEAAN